MEGQENGVLGEEERPRGEGAPQPAEKAPSSVGEEGEPMSPGSEASGVSSSISPHFDPSRDVIIRLEALPEGQMKAVVVSIWASVLVGLGLLGMALDFKTDKDKTYFIEDNTVPIINLSFAVVLFLALLAMWCYYIWRLARANSTGKRWSTRRKRGVQLALAELTLQLINVLFFLIPNAHVLAANCTWFSPLVLWSGLVRWTCWNSIFCLFWIQAHNSHPATGRWARYVGRSDAAIMDAPFWIHWPKLFMWLGFEGVLVGLTAYLQTHPAGVTVPPGTEGDCTLWTYDCTFRGPALGLVISLQSCIVLYALGYLLIIRRSFQVLQALSYKQFRIANYMVRLQVRLRVIAFAFFILCSAVYFFVRLGTCASFVSSWLGFLPMQTVQSAMAIANAFIFMPKRPDDSGILQVWLQEFAWAERDVPRKRAERSSSLPPDSYTAFCMDCEPMFCFETAIKLMYWSYLCYDVDEVKGSPFSSTAALSLYDLDHFELFWEQTLDTKAIVGWNNNTVVIAFRGTASLANVKADLQAWRTRYPPDLGNAFMCSAPMVHKGFLQAWTANKFNDRLIDRLQHILYRCATKQQQEEGAGGEDPGVTLYVTGHSLGGALATLCAYDIKTRCPCAQYTLKVKVYTFGAPRTGNRAFARLYNEALPDTWQIINNDDIVTRGGKFFRLYKRPGHRVLVNRRGDLVVRPTFVESSLRQVPGAGSIRDHLLTQYQKAFAAVVGAQFGRKQFEGGKDGVLSLAETEGTRAALEVVGVAVDTLKDLAEQGLEAVGLRPPPAAPPTPVLTKRRASSGLLGILPRLRRSESEGAEETPTKAEAQAPKGLEAVVVEEGEGAAGSLESPSGGAKLSSTGGPPGSCILHKRARRVCRAAKCRTVCSLQKLQGGGKARRARPAAVAASPMCDAPESPRSERSEGSSSVGRPSMEASAFALALEVQQGRGQPTPPGTPRPGGGVVSTRGSVSEQPEGFSLVMLGQGSSTDLSGELIPEEGEEEEEAEGGGVQNGTAPGAAPPAVVAVR